MIELLSPDLLTPQASIFALLRVIFTRKFVVPEIYDLTEKVSEIEVTRQVHKRQRLEDAGTQGRGGGLLRTLILISNLEKILR